MRLAEIWRYPVKSMAGERLAAAELRRDGIEGDRIVQAWDARDRILTARTHPRLLAHRATIGPDGEPHVEGLAEREWQGRAMRIGRAVVGLADLRGRCVMTTWDPDTQTQDVGVLRDIARRFDSRLCLNATVLEPARIEEGDAVELLGAWKAGG